MLLGMKIDALRRLKGIGKADLARDLGVSRSTVYDWIGGVRLPRSETVTALAGYFSINEATLQDDSVSVERAVRIYKNSQHLTEQSMVKVGNDEASPSHGTGRRLPVLQLGDLRGKNWQAITSDVSESTDNRLGESSDAGAFFVLGHAPESVLPGPFPEPVARARQVLLVEPSAPIASGHLVLAETPSGVVLRKFFEADGIRELRALSADQSSVTYTRGMQLARVRSVTLDVDE